MKKSLSVLPLVVFALLGIFGVAFITPAKEKAKKEDCYFFRVRAARPTSTNFCNTALLSTANVEPFVSNSSGTILPPTSCAGTPGGWNCTNTNFYYCAIGVPATDIELVEITPGNFVYLPKEDATICSCCTKTTAPTP